jgi:hypothetical protein
MPECVCSEHLRPPGTPFAATLAHFGVFHLTRELGYDSLWSWLRWTFCRWERRDAGMGRQSGVVEPKGCRFGESEVRRGIQPAERSAGVTPHPLPLPRQAGEGPRRRSGGRPTQGFEGVKQSTTCHPERSEGSPQFRRLSDLRTTAEILRCAQDDTFRISSRLLPPRATLCGPSQGSETTDGLERYS